MEADGRSPVAWTVEMKAAMKRMIRGRTPAK
jgi:hypothetical protein